MKINIMQAATPTTGVGEKRTLLYITSVWTTQASVDENRPAFPSTSLHTSHFFQTHFTLITLTVHERGGWCVILPKSKWWKKKLEKS